MVIGLDLTPTQMDDAEIAEELNDPFATLVLRAGVFPTTLPEIIGAINAATADEDALRRQMSFLVGEGTQIPWSEETAQIHRGLRLAVTFGRDSEIDVMVSTDASDLTNDFLQVVGWDKQNGVFHFYERVDNKWVWAGNSRHALHAPSRGKGPFDSHVNGGLVMKELKAPWTHWLSVDATVQPEVFAPDDPMRTNPLFTDASGAEVFEERVVRAGVRRWTDARLARTVTDTSIADADTLVRQLFESTTVNLVSASTQSALVEAGRPLELPPSFFIDTDEIVNEPLGLSPPPNLAVAGETYLAMLEKFDVALVDETFRQLGDTHFPFLVPERAFEDIDVVRKCVETSLLSDRFVGCALMVDFPNPVFSARRSSLARFAPRESDRSEPLDEQVARAIEQAAAETPEGSAEREFLALWQLGNGWREEAERRLAAYYAALTARLADPAGFEDIFRLAESRRRRVHSLALAERRPLLFARTNLPTDMPILGMRPDASVQPAAQA